MRLFSKSFPATTLLGALLCAFVTPGTVFAGYGSSGWPIFKKLGPVQPRALAVIFPEHAGIAGTLVNPAVVPICDSRELTFISELGFAEDRLGALMYSVPLQKSTLIAGAAYYDAGTVELSWVDSGGLHSRNVALQRDGAAFVSWGRMLAPLLYGGFTVKGAFSDIAETKSSMAAAADAGLVYALQQGWSFTLVAQNFGAATPFIDTADPLPSIVYAGTGYAYEARTWYLLTALGAAYHVVDEKAVPEAGIEAGNGFIAVNAGYRNADEEGRWQIGLKARPGNFSFGYAFLPGIYLGPVHRLELTYRFSIPSAPAPAAVTPVVTPQKPPTPVKKTKQTSPRKKKKPAADWEPRHWK